VRRPDGADGSPPAEAQRYLDTVAEQVRVEQMVTRSRFIATLAPVADEAAVDAVIAAVRNEFHDARHHATAMVLGSDGQRQRSNDDGEPAGTAGAPMLAVLRGAEVTDVVAVVTRYFGGTLLGAGGLVRAYGGAVTAALAEARRLTRLPVARLVLSSDVEVAGRLEHRVRTWARARAIAIGAGRYDADGVSWRLDVPLTEVEGLRALLGGAGLAHHLAELGVAVRQTPAGHVCEP
jgi:uncharacterized YigZ family protein